MAYSPRYLYLTNTCTCTILLGLADITQQSIHNVMPYLRSFNVEYYDEDETIHYTYSEEEQKNINWNRTSL